MLDINSPDFIESFVPANATVGVVGHGYVGQAVEYFFGSTCRVLVHDKAKPEWNTMDEVVEAAEAIFVCVPTPMRQDGSCYSGIVEEVLGDIVRLSKEKGRNLGTMVVVVKSTVWPGFTDSMKIKFPGLRLVFSPEFLTEANSIQDFVNTNRIVLGGDIEDCRVLFKYFEGRLKDKVESEVVTIAACSSTTAEMVKLFTNGILMTKVLFCNEIYKICEELGLEYEQVRDLAVLDRRIGYSHTTVPGPDGHLGAGGHCFPKDINNLRHVSKELGTGEKLFTAVIERNLEIREKKDWEDMKDRAVTDK
jgi:UDPglucose 6-dehydrogenase